jgi:hypothetical protein
VKKITEIGIKAFDDINMSFKLVPNFIEENKYSFHKNNVQQENSLNT